VPGPRIAKLSAARAALRPSALRGSWQRLRKEPLFWLLAATAVLHLVGLGWGLPNSDGWDNDGVAPRDFLAGLVETFTPGSYFQYPPVHLALLGLLGAPVIVTALAHAKSLAPPDVIAEVLAVPYMTVIAYLARLLTVGMSLGIVYAVARIAEELRGRRAGLLAAATVAVSSSFTYYSHTTNLDVPYLFWGTLALLALVRTVVRAEPRRLRTVAKLAVLAIATKDQAYALFLGTVPATLVLWWLLDPRVRERPRLLLRELGIAAAIAVGMLLVADAIVFNPTGFAARVHFLLGSASQDYAQYSNDQLGRWLIVRDSVVNFQWAYPPVFALFVALGVVVELGLVPRLRHGRVSAKNPPSQRDPGSFGGRQAAALLPLLAIVSFTVFFNCTARRTEHRFVLPQMVLWAVYSGIGLDMLFRVWPPILRTMTGLAVSVAFALALFLCLDVDALFLLDPRYDAEAWMRAHVQPGDLVETYGNNVYLPRFPADARVTRVGPDSRRSPLPGMVEVTAPFGQAPARNARFLVCTGGWVWRYLQDPGRYDKTGRVAPPIQLAEGNDADATTFFRALFAGQTEWKKAHESVWTSDFWPNVNFHGSTGREIWIFQREGP
jgi:4-amino-4-deoxy-L-arabinose transferase-like glycosyltransferase